MDLCRFYWNERCFWHTGGAYAFTAPVGGFVQPLAAGGLPENPETKRRLVNLMRVTGLLAQVDAGAAAPADRANLLRVHTPAYLDAFQAASASGGGELGERTPFGADGYEIAALSAGLAIRAVQETLSGATRRAYALCRPPGHHCLPDKPMGFCLMANIAIAIEAARATEPSLRVAVVDWDVHHGNGTETIFAADPNVLTISLHQENNYPPGSGGADERGTGRGVGAVVNAPLPPGCGDAAYLHAMGAVVWPALQRFNPDLIIVACGFDASGVDPLARMLASSGGFGSMTKEVIAAAEALCAGRLVVTHEGGYSEAHAPFCGHAVIAALAESGCDAPDPFAARLAAHQPSPEVAAFQIAWIDRLAAFFAAA